jgi:ABC-type Fe3+-citrate transport system substrate-binding protein
VATTNWCTHPADLVVARVRRTKNPDLEAIGALAPDLVVANAEENRQVNLDVHRAQGISVSVTDIRTVDHALDSIKTLLLAVGASDTMWWRVARCGRWCRSGVGRGCTWAGTPAPGTC